MLRNTLGKGSRLKDGRKARDAEYIRNAVTEKKVTFSWPVQSYTSMSSLLSTKT